MADDRKRNVLFLCTGNSCRSQMAEAILRRYGGDRFEVYSAGLEPKPVHPMAIEVMREIGIDIGDAQSKDVKQFLGRDIFTYVIVVCSRAQKSCPHAWPGVTHQLFWPFDDPAEAQGTEEERLESFRRTREEILCTIQTWLHDQGGGKA